jgi:hypothetical protein
MKALKKIKKANLCRIEMELRSVPGYYGIVARCHRRKDHQGPHQATLEWF